MPQRYGRASDLRAMKLVAVHDKRSPERLDAAPGASTATTPTGSPAPEAGRGQGLRPGKNKLLRDGRPTLVLYDDAGVPIGRGRLHQREDRAIPRPKPTGGMGFFECINDQRRRTSFLTPAATG